MVSEHTYIGSYADQKRHGAKESTSEVIANAAMVITNIKHLPSPPQSSMTNTDTVCTGSYFPRREGQVQKEYFEQLKDVQKLRDNGTLTQEEFKKNKSDISGAIQGHPWKLFLVD